MGHPV